MPDSTQPIEILPGRSRFPESYIEPSKTTGPFNRRRLVIFSVIFVLGCLVSLSYTFGRPAVYRSTATLLVRPAVTESTAEPGVTSATSLAEIQRQLLTNQDLLSRVGERLQDTPVIQALTPDVVIGLRGILGVTVPPDDSDILELHAEGPWREFLPQLVNTWIEVYLESFANAQETQSDSAYEALRQQSAALQLKITAKRQELEDFRRRYDIVSLERQENRTISRLQGINAALDKAAEEKVAAEARLNAIREALAQGKPIIRDQDQANLASLQARATELRERLRELELRFTPQYMALDPNIVAITRNLEQLERQIESKRQESQRAALETAERELISAREALNTLQRQADDYKQQVMEFTARFGEHEAAQEELIRLEELNQEIQDRLVTEEVVKRNQPPQIMVLDYASLPRTPIHPHYLRDASLSVGASLLLGLVAIWLYEFLTRSGQPVAGRIAHPGVQSYFFNLGEAPSSSSHDQKLPVTEATHALTHQPLPRELSEFEIEALMETAEPADRLLLSILLSGPTEEETVSLCWKHLDLKADELQLPGPSPRAIPLTEPLRAMLLGFVPEKPVPDASIGETVKGYPLDSDDLTALVICLAHDAGLNHADEVTPSVLRHTYLAFLVRQGLRLMELERLAGRLSSTTLAHYGALSPPRRGLTLEQIERVYPTLEKSDL